MANKIDYDPDEHLFSPLSDAASQFLNEDGSRDLPDLNSIDITSGIRPSQINSINTKLDIYPSQINSIDTKSSIYPSQISSTTCPFQNNTTIYPSQNNSVNSPLQLRPYSPELFCDDLELNFIETKTIDFSSVTQPTEKLRILAQPRSLYRERYNSETDPNKNRAQRFIRADDDSSQHEYPTVQIPSQWRDPNRDLYIQVTLVTVFSGTAPVICIHPYAIDTQETGVLRDLENNSLYFPVTKEEIISGEKSFRISRKKMIQHDLRSYGLFRLFSLNQNDIQRVTNIHDAKQIIEIYQLWKSQLVFTIAERLSKDILPISISSTSVISQVMCDETSGRRKELLTDNTVFTHVFDDDTIKCTPRKGDWNGGDEILMVIPKLDKRKVFNIYFDYGPMGKFSDINVSFVDSKSIFFQTPPCSMLAAERNLTVPIIITQNDLIIGRVDFVYLTPYKPATNICSRCQFDMTYNNRGNYKRPYYILDSMVPDGGESLVQQMNRCRIATGENGQTGCRAFPTDDANSKFDKYLGQLQEAIVEFVRTNNPSRLFRRTRLLLARCEENPPPLHDAIQYGHIDLVLKLIEQVSDMSPSNSLLEQENNDGETPLLLSAKFNHWILIEAILKKRIDLSKKTDKFGNNIFHLLASVSEDKSNETIKNVLELLPNDIKTNLLKQKNKANQIPTEIAHIKNNIYCINLLKNF